MATPAKRTRADRETPDATTAQSGYRLWRAANRKPSDANGLTLLSGMINVEAPRRHRESAQATNRLTGVRSELAKLIREKPIQPNNQYQTKIPSR